MSDNNSINANHEILSRFPELGMEPKSILIGDRLRHTVHNGALKMPHRALQLIKEVSVPLEETDRIVVLPSVDSVVRPTLDKVPITVTILRIENVFLPPAIDDVNELENLTSPVATTQTVAVNETWNSSTQDVDRIRGGGKDDEETSEAKRENSQFVSNSVADSLGPAPASVPDPPVRAAPASVPDPPVRAAPASFPDPPVRAAPASTDASPLNVPPPNTMELQVPALTPPAIHVTTTSFDETAEAHAVQTTDVKMEANAISIPSVSPHQNQPVLSNSEIEPESSPAPLATMELAAPVVPIINPEPAPATTLSSQKDEVIKSQSSQGPSAISTSQSTRPQVIASSLKSAPPKSPKIAAKLAGPVVGLAKVPPPQYAQVMPGPNDEMQVEIKNVRAPWYNKDKVSEIERTLLPEWFDSSALHRTPASYIKAREHILQMSTQLGNRFITNTLIRRTVPGDAGSLNRLFNFLMAYGFINADAINDSTPTTSALRDTKKRSFSTFFEDSLAHAILKRHKTDASSSIDWQEVADEIGDGASAADCQKGFLSLDLDAVRLASPKERSITPDPSEKSDPMSVRQHDRWELESILTNTDDTVLIPTVETALKQTQDLGLARNASVIALIASHAALKAKTEEDTLSHVLAELTEMRMSRLEKRIELLNDVEGMLEAERMALELERRDLYTSRCRHWFGGSS